MDRKSTEEVVRRLRAKGHSHTYGDGRRKYDVYSLWLATAEAPIRTLTMRELAPLLYHDCWGIGAPPVMVMADSGAYPDHWRRIKRADTTFPILLTEKGRHLVDGAHRLCSLAIDGIEDIPVRFVSEAALEAAAL